MEKKKKNNTYKYIIVAVIFLFVGIGASYLIVQKFPNLFTKEIVKKNVNITDNGIAESVDKIYDAVVVVSTYKNDRLYGTGTGFVYKTEGKTAYILTNNHVIENGSKVTVTFTNGSIIETKVVGSDALSDIAVLSVKSSDIISVADIGSSDDLRVGDTAFAVGAPLDSIYSGTVTRGIISGKDRMVEVSLSSSNGDYIMKVLQTDAAINNGNSGGPLCNANGEVVGITSLKLSGGSYSTGASIEGMGFAIPIEIASSYAEKIISGEKIVQPYLGVQMLNVTDAIYYSQYYAELNKYQITSGVLVVSVENGSPADKAGFEAGDIITKINVDETPSIAYLRYYLYNYEVGNKVKVTVKRNGKEKILDVTLGTNKQAY